MCIEEGVDEGNLVGDPGFEEGDEAGSYRKKGKLQQAEGVSTNDLLQFPRAPLSCFHISFHLHSHLHLRLHRVDELVGEERRDDEHRCSVALGDGAGDSLGHQCPQRALAGLRVLPPRLDGRARVERGRRLRLARG